MSEGPTTAPRLPELPDVNGLLMQARAVRSHYVRQRDEAQAHINEADKVIGQLTGGGVRGTRSRTVREGRRSRAGEPTAISEAAYLRILTEMGNHNYASAETIAGRVGYSASHVRVAGRLGEQRGHVSIEHRRTHRYRLTEHGQEFVTRSAES